MRSNNSDLVNNLPVTNRLMLQACLLPAGQQREEMVRQWEDIIVMDDMDYSAMRLSPLFLRQNQLAGINTKYDNRLKIIYKHWWLKTQHILDQLKKVYAAFKSDGIDAIVIKGASVMSYYESPELRPMADFDLLIKPAEMSVALKILHNAGYVPDKVMEATFNNIPALLTDFRHSIECIHTISGARIDLHWRVGSLCSLKFTDDLWQHLDADSLIPYARKPRLSYEAFMILMHGVLYGSWDNLNWIIDINLLNLKTNRSFWEDARRLAVSEKKEDLFDHGCAILLKFGVYALQPQLAGHPRTIIELSPEARRQMPFFKLYVIKLKNFFLFLKRLFPNSSIAVKFYQGIRLTRLFLIYRRYKWLYRC